MKNDRYRRRRGLHGFALCCIAMAVGRGAVTEAAAGSRAAQVVALPNGLEVSDAAMRLRVTAISDDILRVRISPGKTWPEDASWAVPAEVRARRITVTPFERKSDTGFGTASLAVSVEGETHRLVIRDRAGHVIVQDAMKHAAARTFRDGAFELRMAMPQGAHYYGLGDKTGPLDRRGGAFVNWNTDVGRFSEATDPLYKAIPFFIATGGEGGAYGVFLDNTWRSWFDFGKRDPDVLAFGADGGAIDYYVINGPTVKDVVRRYADLTGTAPLAPLWSLGYQQSRYSYMSADEVRDIAARLRREQIPTDVIWLDIDFQDRNRPFTTNAKTYPDLPKLAQDMRDAGIRLVAITDLHIAHAPDQGYAPYDSGAAGDHFLKNKDGETFVGKVWPGASVFPDFTRAPSRDWWGRQYQAFVDAGVAGFWNDMNEPALFGTATKTMPLDVQHRIETPGFAARTATHAEIHNVYGMENTRATFDGLRALRPDERAFVMTRATYAGGQRYAVTWTGDNSSTWSHLKLSVSQLLNLGMSGFGYSAADVGGFTGGASPELMTRWFQIAAFTPIFRDHSANDAPRAEPWVDGPQHTAIRKRFVEERYRLLPYLYALADENARTGAPLMRPLFYEFPQAGMLPCDQSMTFLLGAGLLIAASPTPESPRDYKICLPAGGWYDYWTGLAVPGTTGEPVTLNRTPTLADLPVYVRAGTILPRQPLVQSTTDTPRGALRLDVYPGANCQGTLYTDDGHSMAYAVGAYLRQNVRCEVTSDGLKIDFDAREGTFQPWWKTLEIVVHGWSAAGKAEQDGKTLEATSDQAAQTIAFSIEDSPRAVRIALSRAQ